MDLQRLQNWSLLEMVGSWQAVLVVVVPVVVVVELQEAVQVAVVVVAILEVVFGSAWRACFGTQARSLV